MRIRILAFVAVLIAAALQPLPARADSDELLDQLMAIPGLTVVSETQPTGFRFFVLSYAQPIDHRHPDEGTFVQRLTLLHRSVDAPVVLATGGYGLAANPTPARAEPTRLIDGNQISIEHRFFSPSRPDPADWDDLDIWQEASDEHRIVQAFKTIYSGAWIRTGASKGGMASVYHHRFYPDDLDGVVAYVAPNDAVNALDRRYVRFFETVGDEACRTALKDVQREALRRRDRLVPMLEADAASNGYTYTNTVGSLDRSFELTVLDTAFAFWQLHRSPTTARTSPAWSRRTRRKPRRSCGAGPGSNRHSLHRA